jgi:hypothetical protein
MIYELFCLQVVAYPGTYSVAYSVSIVARLFCTDRENKVARLACVAYVFACIERI